MMLARVKWSVWSHSSTSKARLSIKPTAIPPFPPPAAIVNGVSTSKRIAAMAPPSRLHKSSTATGYTETAQLPPFSRSVTAPPTSSRTTQQSLQTQTRPDPSHLAPEDAFLALSPPRRTNGFEATGNDGLLPHHLRRRTKEAGSRSRSRRRKRPWKKLLWVKQPCEFASHPSSFFDP